MHFKPWRIIDNIGPAIQLGGRGIQVFAGQLISQFGVTFLGAGWPRHGIGPGRFAVASARFGGIGGAATGRDSARNKRFFDCSIL